MSPDQRRISTLASEGAVHRAFNWLHLHQLQLRRWQLEFLAIPAPPFHEDARAVWFCQRFRDLGLANPHIDAEGNAVALLSAKSFGPETPTVLLSAHLDTVFPPRTVCAPREDGAIIRCPGACDNGAGLAALLALAAALKHARLRPAANVLFAANVGEEGEGDLRGMRHLFSSAYAEPAAAIALEGAGNGLVVDRALGSRRLRVTLTGPGGHSWADSHRPNPILALSAAILAIARLPLPKQPRTTLNIGTLQGGTSVNSVPSTAIAEIDLRSTSELVLDRLEMAVHSRISTEIEAENQIQTRDRPESSRLQLHIERTGHRATGSLPHDAPLLRSLRAIDRHLGLTTEPRLASTDANLPLSRNIPALAIGAGGKGGGLHTTAEWYDPTGRDLALRRILLLLLDTCTTLATPAPGSETLATPAQL